MSDSKILRLSRCTGGISNTQLSHWKTTFSQLCEQLTSPPTVGRKDGSYFERGPFREGCPTRADANIESANLIVLDGDSSVDPETDDITEGAPPPIAVHEALLDLDIPHVLYTSFSHGKPGKGNRYRVLIPAKVADKEALAACVKALSPGVVPDLSRRLSGMQDQLTYICGGRDAKYGRIAGRISGSCPRAMTAIVPGCGHNVHVQAPAICAGLVMV